MMTAPTRPVLRWHGGKWMLAPWIISHFPSHRVYTEAFGGAASVLLRKPRAFAEIYNDLDGAVVRLFRVLRDESKSARLIRSIELTPYSREEFEASWKEPEDADDVEASRRLIARCLMGFASHAHNTERTTGFRALSHQSGTAPSRDWMNYPGELPAIIERLRGVTIESIPATQLLEHHDGEDVLHYVDPPYPHSTRQRGQTKNYRHEMTDEDHRALGFVLNRLRGGVILSGYPCPLYDTDLFPHWHRMEREALADGARKRTEVLWINESAWKAGGRLL